MNTQTPQRALGRKPLDKTRIERAIRLRDVLTGKLPAHPLVVDHYSKVTFGMYGNDKFGVCGPTAVANYRRMLTHYLTGKQHNPTQADVFDLYKRSGNPDFDPTTGADDNGVVVQTMLEAVVAGGIGGVKGLAFAKLDPGNEQELYSAISIFGGIILGVDLQTAQQAQTDAGMWVYKRSGDWGGHCILGGGLNDKTGKTNDLTDVVTWAEVIKMAESFRAHQLDEAWILIFPEHLNTVGFEQGIDKSKLEQYYKDLTGETLAI